MRRNKCSMYSVPYINKRQHHAAPALPMTLCGVLCFFIKKLYERGTFIEEVVTRVVTAYRTYI